MNYEFVDLETFSLLSQKAQARLSSEDKAAYTTALESFVAAWQAEYPEGYQAVVRVKSFSLRPSQGQHAITVDVSQYNILRNISPNGVFRLPVKVADVLATNAGFNGFSHMALTSLSATNKGEVSISITLNVKGESWESRNGQTGKYKSTFLNAESFEYQPSPQVAARMAKATESAAQEGYNRLLDYADVESTGSTRNDEPVEEEPENVEV